MHKSKLYHEKLSEESPKTMAKTAKKKKARQMICAFHFAMPRQVTILIHQLHLWLKPLLGSQESPQCLSARLSDDSVLICPVNLHNGTWNACQRCGSDEFPLKTSSLEIGCVRWIVLAEIGFWRIASSALHGRLTHFKPVLLTWCQFKKSPKLVRDERTFEVPLKYFR